MTKFGVPFSGAADEDIGGQDAARKGSPFKPDQVDESRLGAMRGDPKYAHMTGCEPMQASGRATDGFTKWKKMDTFE